MSETGTKEPLTEASLSPRPVETVPEVMDTAQTGFAAFSVLPMEKRIELLKELRYLIADQAEQLSRIISESTGKPVTEALTTEVMVVCDAILHAQKRAPEALATRRIKTPITFIGKSSYSEYKPRGTVLIISPWNFPFMLAMVPAVEALAAGNSIILKPSEETPRVAAAISSVFEKIGFPRGTVQVLLGGPELGDALVRARPDFVHFTGSVATGRSIASVTGPGLIPTTLELGGKDPMVVFDDANIERAVQGALWGAFSNSGQVCMSVERLYVQRTIFDDFVKKLVQETQRLKVGYGGEDDIGPMTTLRQLQTVKRHVLESLAQGARLECGDHPDRWDMETRLIRPMVLTQVNHQMALMHEETFGPVLPVMAFDDETEAVLLANDSTYGLNSSVWTRDSVRGKRVISLLDTGGALLNDVILTIGNPYLPYGGAQDSGVGAYHADLGIQNFAQQKAVMVDRGRKLREVNWFPYQGKQVLFETLLTSYWGSRKNLAKFGYSYLRLLARAKKG